MKTRILYFVFFCFFAYGLSGQDELSQNFYDQADSLINIGNFREAIGMYKLYLDAVENKDTPDWETVSEAFNNLGACYYLTRDYPNAAQAFKEALEIDSRYNHENVPARMSNLGMVYKKQGFYDKAIQYYLGAVELARVADDQEGLAIYYNNIGAIYDQWGKYDEAIEYYQKSLRIKEKQENKEGIANTLSNIGMVYNAWKKFDQAIENFKEALAIDIELKFKDSQAVRLNNIGLSFYNMEQYDSALFYYEKSLNLNISLGLKDQVATQYNNIGMVYFKREEYTKANNYLMLALKIYQELQLTPDIATVYSNIGLIQCQLENYDTAEEYLLKSDEEAEKINLRSQQVPNLERLSMLYEKMGQHDQALEYYKRASALKDSVYSEEIHEQIADFEIKYESERKEKEIEILKKTETINNLELRKQRIFRNSFIIGFVLVFLLALLIYLGLRQRIRANTIIEKEKAISDKLLHNILPSKVAKDLKEKGMTAPESFDNVTVLFTDLVGFTHYSSLLDPQVLIDELNDIFTAFDNIIASNNCERIKTIGDAYFAVCGLPEPDPDHAVNMISAALEMMNYIKERKAKYGAKWEMRIGIHTGQVVAGIVGIKKYSYDVFGDTINTAARMESHSENMRIHVSQETYSLTKHKFKYSKRDEIEVKGKGKMMTYFLEGALK